jgi:hypothetical protein
VQLEDFHVEDAELAAVVGEAERNHAAHLFVARGFDVPPAAMRSGVARAL